MITMKILHQDLHLEHWSTTMEPIKEATKEPTKEQPLWQLQEWHQRPEELTYPLVKVLLGKDHLKHLQDKVARRRHWNILVQQDPEIQALMTKEKV
jgi:hypothetical protein